MEIVAKVIETLNSPEVPLGVKLLIFAVLVAAIIFWFAKPPHWRDAETPTLRSSERQARPPD
jgi:hypothetical protein